MTKKRKYKSISVNDKRVPDLLEKLCGGRVIVGIDIAKTRQFAAFMTADGQVGITNGIAPISGASDGGPFSSSVGPLCEART